MNGEDWDLLIRGSLSYAIEAWDEAWYTRTPPPSPATPRPRARIISRWPCARESGPLKLRLQLRHGWKLQAREGYQKIANLSNRIQWKWSLIPRASSHRANDRAVSYMFGNTPINRKCLSQLEFRWAQMNCKFRIIFFQKTGKIINRHWEKCHDGITLWSFWQKNKIDASKNSLFLVFILFFRPYIPSRMWFYHRILPACEKNYRCLMPKKSDFFFNFFGFTVIRAHLTQTQIVCVLDKLAWPG